MAGTSANDFQNGAPFYLDPNQQDLLLAALSSNGQNTNDIFAAGLDNKPMNGQHFQFPDGQYAFTSPQQGTPATFNNGGVDESPFEAYLDGEGGFDFEGADTGDLMIGDLPGDSPGETSEKRKSPGDADEDGEGGGKRREGEDKQAKKPGRKPLTSEPTTVCLLPGAERCVCTNPRAEAESPEPGCAASL
jgi:AP-1-like factor